MPTGLEFLFQYSPMHRDVVDEHANAAQTPRPVFISLYNHSLLSTLYLYQVSTQTLQNRSSLHQISQQFSQKITDYDKQIIANFRDS